MADTTYLQRLIGRMGTPATDVLPFSAPVLPIYDPFVEALDEEIIPPPAITMPPESQSAELNVPAEIAPPVEIVRTSFVQPLADSEPVERTLYETITPPNQELPSRPTLDLIAPTENVPLAETLRTVFVEPPIDNEPFERMVHETLEPSPESVPLLLPDRQDAFLTPEVETVEQIIHEFIEPPAQPPLQPLEPPVALETPPVAALSQTPAPQITIGDIVVEIVTKPAAAPSTPSRPSARASGTLAPMSPSSPRGGVRSKRGYGLGQI